VLDGCPLDDDLDPIVARMWDLQRSAMYRDMRVVGVEVVAWPATIPLETAMRPIADSNRVAPRRRSR